MKANNINGTIRLFSQLPRSWNNIDNFQAADETMQQAEGFFNVVEPVIDPITQQKGAIYFDSVNKVFTYYVINKVLPTLEEAKALKITELKNAVKGLYQSVQWYLEMCRNDGEPIPAAVKTKISVIRTKYEAAKAQINSYTTVIDVLKWKVPYDQITTIRESLESLI